MSRAWRLLSPTLLRIAALAAIGGCGPGKPHVGAPPRHFPIQTGPLGGSYLTLDQCYDLSQWRHELELMRRSGLDTLALAGVYDGDSNRAYYASRLPGAVSGCGGDELASVLTLADELGFSVYVGPLEIGCEWWGSCLASAASLHRRVAREVYDGYKAGHPSFKGWYVRQEVLLNDIVEWGAGVGTVQYQRQVAADLDAIAPLPILTPPYFMTRPGPEGGAVTPPTPQQVGDALAAYLAQVPQLDVIALQDGIGAGHASLAELPSYYAAAAQAAGRAGKTLWSEIENFEPTGNPNGYMFQPAGVARLSAQVAAELPHVEKLITWVFNQFQSPQSLIYPAGGARLDGEYVSEFIAPHNAAGARPYTFSVAPSPAHPDIGGELTDGIESDGSSLRPWVGWNGVTSHAVTLDLGATQELQFVRALAASQAGAGIYYPTALSVEVSDDGTTFRPFGWRSRWVADSTAALAPNWSVVPGNDRARFVRLNFEQGPGRWTMISEVEVKGGLDPAQSDLALGKTYTLTPAPSPSYPDTGGQEMTDGAASMDRLGSAGFPTGTTSATATLVLDLGQTRELSIVALSTGGGAFGAGAGADFRATAVDVSTSTDGTSYALRGSDAGGGAWASVSFDAPARYVKVVARKAYGGAQKSWLFVGEVEVMGASTTDRPPDTPSLPAGPTSGSAGASASYSASATDPDGDEVKITFDWGDGTRDESALVEPGAPASLFHSWTAAGTFGVRAMATDARGATSGWSAPLAVVIAAPDTTPPEVSITAPASGASVAGLEVVSANATDDVGVARVDYYLDGALIGTSGSPGYAWTWDTTAFSNGAHALSARAYDAAGNTATSPQVSVTVANPPPGGNIARSKPYTVSPAPSPTYGDAAHTKLTDGDTGASLASSAGWPVPSAGSTKTVSVVVDLAAASPVSRVRIFSGGGLAGPAPGVSDYRADSVALSGSADGVGYFSLGRATATAGGWIEVPFPITTVRWLKLDAAKKNTGVYGTDWLFIGEIEAY